MDQLLFSVIPQLDSEPLIQIVDQALFELNDMSLRMFQCESAVMDLFSYWPHFKRILEPPDFHVQSRDSAAFTYRVFKQFFARSNLWETEQVQEISFSADCWNRNRKWTFQNFPPTFYGPYSRQNFMLCWRDSLFWFTLWGRRAEENRSLSQAS